MIVALGGEAVEDISGFVALLAASVACSAGLTSSALAVVERAGGGGELNVCGLQLCSL